MRITTLKKAIKDEMIACGYDNLDAAEAVNKGVHKGSYNGWTSENALFTITCDGSGIPDGYYTLLDFWYNVQSRLDEEVCIEHVYSCILGVYE